MYKLILQKNGIHNLKLYKICSIIRKYLQNRKRRVTFILASRIRYYTKESIKLISIIVLGILIIISIMLIKFKPVYGIALGSTQIGYVKNKNNFNENLNKILYENTEENIAFSDIGENITYTLKLVAKEEEIADEKAIKEIKNQADITYYTYAVSVNGEEKIYTKTEEEAKNIVEELNKKIPETNVAFSTIYTKDLEITSSEDVANIKEEIISEIKNKKEQEKQRQQRTINGIYLAVNPVSGRITSRYGAREFSVRDHTHQGLDIGAKTGTPIKAVASATVKFAGTKNGYGNMIILKHGNGIETYYGHCSKLYVKEGEKVEQGDVIAAVGSTGNSTGPHLHFEVRKGTVAVNPMQFFN